MVSSPSDDKVGFRDVATKQKIRSCKGLFSLRFQKPSSNSRARRDPVSGGQIQRAGFGYRPVCSIQFACNDYCRASLSDAHFSQSIGTASYHLWTAIGWKTDTIS